MKKYLVKINILFLLLIFLGNGVPIFAKGNPNNVNFLKAGDSQCILIKSNKENILIDVGEKKYEKNILNYLKKEGINELDAIILTSFNKDSSTSLDEILENFTINKIYLSNYCDNKINKDLIIKKLKEKNIMYDFIEKGWSYSKGNIYIEAKSSIKKEEASENNSIMLYGIIDKVKYLFTSESLFNLKDNIKNLNNARGVDVVHISKECKNNFISKEIIKYLNPRIAVLSCEKTKCDTNIESLLEKKGRKIYTTEKDGNIKIQRSLGSKRIEVFSYTIED